MWMIEGSHVQTQQLSLERGDPEVLSLLGLAADRHRVRCPRCGFDVIAGDRLGPRPGVRHLWETERGAHGDRSAAAKTDRALSKIADAGLTRLSLSALGLILSW